MNFSNIGDVNNLFSVIIALMGIGGIFFKYLKTSLTKEKLHNIKDSFNKTVTGLSSEIMSEKIASAILLRRFYDENTEMGIGKTPYAKETTNVISGLLKFEQTGDFQKILGDSLAYANSLNGADLQRTNLQNVYLSGEHIDISKADFFRADLSNASLKDVKGVESVFYEARLCGTIFKGATLDGANFMSSDLDGANFKDASLEDANFENAINIPDDILKYLNEQGVYSKENSNAGYNNKKQKTIFIAMPGLLSDQQKIIFDSIKAKIKAEGFKINILLRENYQKFGITAELKRLIQSSDGTLVFGFCDINIQKGTYRNKTAEEKQIEDTNIMSPWIHTEIGIALGSSKPILLIMENEYAIDFGTFETGVQENSIEKLFFSKMNIERDLVSWIHKI